jgi:hypothetical protein
VNNGSELNTQQKSKPEFDPVEAARQIKNVIGIGQTQQQQQQQQQNPPPPKPLMDIKPLMGDQQSGQQQQQKSNIVSSKSTGPTLHTKVTPPPPLRIPHQPVIFSDRFDGGMNKIDIQFGNLSEPLEDTSSQNRSIPASSSSAFYQHSEPVTSMTKHTNVSSSNQNLQRSATAIHHQSAEQSSFVSPTAHTNSIRSSEQQQPVMNQQRMLPPQIQQQQQQQPSMTMKPVVPPQYALHQQQQQMNAPNMLLHSLLFHHQQQQQEVYNNF